MSFVGRFYPLGSSNPYSEADTALVVMSGYGNHGTADRLPGSMKPELERVKNGAAPWTTIEAESLDRPCSRESRTLRAIRCRNSGYDSR
jgi:hypothetical protein